MSLGKVTAVAALCSLSVLTWEGESRAASKDECVDAHSRGQDVRERGQLTRARQLFLACAQSSCPGLIQGDCARFGDELDRLLPSVSFGARDARATDLPNTTVYVDDVLVATRLDDGKAYDLDPGKHTVRFVHDGKEATLRAILNQGEKGRTLVATFLDSGGTSAAPQDTDAHTAHPEPKRPLFPLAIAGVGAAAIVTGGVMLGVGLKKVPDSCAVSSKECAAPPGDPAFDGAHSGVLLANAGVGVGIGGVALLAGGLLWYFAQPKTQVQPWTGRGSGGLLVLSSF